MKRQLFPDTSWPRGRFHKFEDAVSVLCAVSHFGADGGSARC
jgi:hypothetical protein